MLPRPAEFIQDVRRAARLEQKPKVLTDSSKLGPDQIAAALHGAAIWLTPKIVEKYASEDFGECPADQQERLRLAVETFRGVAGEVPPDKPATGDQLARGLTAFHELLAAVRDVVLREWTNAVERFIRDAEGWVAESGWRSRRVERQVNEALLGTYPLPQLQVFAEADLYVFDPVGRFVPGGMGAYDLAIQPSYYLTSLYRDYDGRWYGRLDVGRGIEGAARFPWDKEAFLGCLRELRSLV